MKFKCINPVSQEYLEKVYIFSDLTKFALEEKINCAIENQWNDKTESIFINLCLKEDCYFNLSIPKAHFEEIPVYDPDVWNDLSKVEPPVEGVYRVEFRNSKGAAYVKEAAYWNGDEFITNISCDDPLKIFFKAWD